MKKSLLLAVLVIFVGCKNDKQTYIVADVTNKTTITLHKNNGQGYIHRITIVAKGHLDGSAQINLILNGKPYKTENLSGKIDFEWGGDWYSDSAKIQYKPSSVNSGNLSLKYTFYD